VLLCKSGLGTLLLTITFLAPRFQADVAQYSREGIQGAKYDSDFFGILDALLDAAPGVVISRSWLRRRFVAHGKTVRPLLLSWLVKSTC